MVLRGASASKKRISHVEIHKIYQLTSKLPVNKRNRQIETQVDQQLPPHSLPQAGPPSEHKYCDKRRDKLS